MGKRETGGFCGCSRNAKSQGSAVSGTFFLAFVVLFAYLGYAASFDGFRVFVLNGSNVLGEPVHIDVFGPNSTNFTMNVYWNQSLVLSQNAVTDAFGMFSSRPNFSVPGRYTANISRDNVSPSVASALFYVVFPNGSGNGSLFFIQPMRETVSNWSADNASGVNASMDVNMSGGVLNATINAVNVTGHANETDELGLSLVALKSHFGLDERPSFDFGYTSEKELDETSKGISISSLGKPKKGLGKLVTDSGAVQASVYCGGELKDIDVEITEEGSGNFSIEVLKPRGFRAGAYMLSVKMLEDGEMYVQEEEFLWGLVSLNTKKSIYRPGEVAEFIIVVLDREGHPVCGADVSLMVADPNGEVSGFSTFDGSVFAGSECGIYNAGYVTEVEGVHTMDVSAVVSGTEVYFDTYFAVMEYFEFDIVRVAQSKIDPTRQEWFDVRIDIESFVGGDSVVVKEFVPAVFNVLADAQDIRFEDDTKTITWNKDLAGNKTFVSYSYSVQHVWPYLYALGPAEISYDSQTFTEARSWYVAVDPELEHRYATSSTSDVSITGAGNELGAPDESTAYISGEIGDDLIYWEFTMNDTEHSGDNFNSARIGIRYYESGWADDYVRWEYSDDGSTWYDLEYWPTTSPATSLTTRWFDAANINSWTEVDACLVKLRGSGRTGPRDVITVYVDAVELEVNYTIPDSTPPTIENEALNASEININEAVRLNASTADAESDVTDAKFTIKYLNGTSVNFTADEVSENYWEYNFSDTSQRGQYNWTYTYATSDGGTNSTVPGLTFDAYDATGMNLVLFNSSNPIRGTAVNILARLVNSTSDGVWGQNITFLDGAAVIGYGLTNSTGWAEVDWDVSSVETLGAHIINVTYAGNASECYRAVHNDTESVTVWAATSVPLVVLNNSNPTAGDVVRIDAKLVYDNTTAIEGQNISFYYNSTLIGSDATNSTGWAVIDWDTTGVSGGIYTVNATYTGNSSLYTEASHNDTGQATVAGPPAVGAIHTYDNATLAGKTVFAREDGMTVRVNVTDDGGATDISTVLIEILNTTGDCEVCNETMANITGITDGYTYEYNWTIPQDAEKGSWTVNVYANDTLDDFGSNSGAFTVKETDAPQITLIAPLNDSEHTSCNNITFVYNVSDESDITNCSLIINGLINITNTSVQKDTNQSIYSTLADSLYTWSVNCTDVYGNQNSSVTRDLNVNVSVPTYNEFDGDTTDFTAEEDIKKVKDCTLEVVEEGKIVWKDEVNARSQNFDEDVAISHNLISVDISKMHGSFNSEATLQFYNLTYTFIPLILMDGEVCPGSVCSVESYDSGIGLLVFNVTHFTSYVSSANSKLAIWDDADAEGGSQLKYASEQLNFFANYTNYTSGESINDTGVYCNISFNVGGWSAWEEMEFNSSTLLYEYNRSFSSPGTFDWNVTCNGSVLGYEPLDTIDDVTIHSHAFLILFWDGGAAPPGWTIISDEAGEDFYQRFPRGNGSYGGFGGAETHMHTVTQDSVSSGPNETASTKRGDQVGMASSTHTHPIGDLGSTASASSLPTYRTLKVIVYNSGIPSTIPAGAIAMFNTTPPSGWSPYTAHDGYFIRGNTTPNGTYTNADGHTQSFSVNLIDSTTGIAFGNSGTDFAATTHDHTLSGNTDSQNEWPLYIEVVLAKADSETSIPEEMLGMFNETPSVTHWDIKSDSGDDFYQRYLFANTSTSFPATGGQATHQHASQSGVQSGGANQEVAYGPSSSLETGATAAHIHTVDISFSEVDNLPPYRDVIIASFADKAPVVEEPKTYNFSLTELSDFEVGENVTIRVNVTDADSASELDTVLITITNPQSTVKVSNATMTSIANITKGHTYEYNYTAMPKDSTSVGTWNIDIYANDSYDYMGYNTTTFEGIIPKINVTANESAYNSSETVNASGTFFYDNGDPIAGRNVTVEFINTTGEVVQTDNITTDSSGYYSDAWDIPLFSTSGIYTVNVTGTTDLNTATNTTTFPVYGATYGSTMHAPPTHTSSSITQTAGDQFDLTVTYENQGPDTAKSVNISLVNSTGITLNSTFEECGDVSSGSSCVKSFEVTVAPTTVPGTYWVNSTTTWLNNNTQENSTDATTEITVASNLLLDIPETEIMDTVDHSQSEQVGNFTVNATGNDALNSVNFYAVGGTLPQSWLSFEPSTIAALAAGNTQNVNVTVAVPAGQAPALYWTNLTVNSTEGKEDWMWLNITVPTDDSWTRTPVECEKGIGINQTGTLCIVTVNNTGNVPESFNVTPDTVTNYTEPDETTFDINPWSIDTFNILYNSTDADVGNYTVTYNISGNGTPSYLLIDVNLTVYNYTLNISIVSPTQAIPTENRTAGETLQIRAETFFNNGTDEWEEKEDMTWDAVYIGATECPITDSAFDPVADNWEINCTLPDITDATWYDLTLEGEKTPENITGQGKETNAVHYKDVTVPSIFDISVSPTILEIKQNVTIAANVTDNVLVDDVWAEITGAVTVNLTMSILTGNRYLLNYTPPTNGTYNVRIYANDTPIGNLDNTSLYQFSVYNTTTGNLEQTPSSVDVSDITWTDSGSFVITLSFHNTGNTTAYSTNLTIEKPAGWDANSTFEECGDVAKSGSCIRAFNITVPAATASNTFYINGTAEWRNPDDTISNATNQTTVNVLSNPILDVPETAITDTVAHGTEETVGSFTVNSTGNDNLTNVQFDCVSGNMSSSWVEYTPGSISTLAAGSTQSVDVNLTVPAGGAPGDYYCKINVTSSNDGSDWLWLNITVPLDDSWTRTPAVCTKMPQVNKTGSCTTVTVQNTGNVLLNFSVIPTTLTNYTEPSKTSFEIAAQGSDSFDINYNTTGATIGEVKITSYNTSSNSTETPYQLTTVTLTIVELQWWNSSWLYRRTVDVTEPGISQRVNWPMNVFIDTGGNVGNCTKEFRALDDENNLIPYTVYNETYSGEKCQSANVVFLVNETQSEIRTYYIYYGNPSASTQPYSIWQDNCGTGEDSTSCVTIYYSRRILSSGLDTWNTTTSLGMGNEDYKTRSLPWTFKYFNQSFSSVYVLDNGFLEFASTTADSTPSQAEFAARDMIAALWDDYDPDSTAYPIVNGDFESGNVTESDAYNWTESVSGTAPISTVWETSGGNPNGNMYMHVTGSDKNSYGYADQDFTYNWELPPNSVTLNFDWYRAVGGTGDADLFVQIKRPGQSFEDVWSYTGTGTDWNSVSNINITSNFTSTGTYTIRLYAHLTTSSSGSSNAHAKWDNVVIKVNYSMFDVYENQQSSPSRMLWTWDMETDENLYDATHQAVLYSTGDVMLRYGPVEGYDQSNHLAGISNGDSLNYLNNLHGNNQNTAFYQFSGAATTDVKSEEKLILPNITTIAIYDVTGQADTHTGGTLVKSSQNDTFDLFEDYDLHSRGIHRVEVNVTGNASWIISANTIAYQENLDSSWIIDTTNDIWYTNGTQDFTGGTFSSGRVTWDTSGGDVLEDGIVTFAYVVNLSGYTQARSVYFFINETDHTHANGLSWDEDYSVYNVTQVGYLEVVLAAPPDNTIVPWERNFTVNSTVYCRSGDCWDVYGYVRYNESSLLPDASVSATPGDVPFYVNDGKGNPQSCGDMLIDDYCTLSWVVNSTGSLGDEYEIGVLFNSTLNQSNHTTNSTVEIWIILLFSLNVDEITTWYIPPENPDDNYDAESPTNLVNPGVIGSKGSSAVLIELDDNSNDADGGIWVKGTNMTADPLTNYSIPVWNISICEGDDYPTPNSASSCLSDSDNELQYDYQNMLAGMNSGEVYNITLFLDVQYGIAADTYRGTVYIMANATTE